MKSNDIFFIAIAVAALGYSIYKKYIKKNQPGKHAKKPDKTGSSFSSVKDDSYEPYSKK
jgi:uncharacterized membrane protein YebE (DUF533 family)